VNIRDAATADIEAIAALHAESWRRTYRGMMRDQFLDGDVEQDRLEEWHERLRAPAANQFVPFAENDGALEGFVCAFGDEDARWGTLIDNLHVRHDVQARGIGRALMHAAAAWAVERYPATAVYLLVLRANVNAQRFYERIGGTNAGPDERPGADGETAFGYVYAWRDPRALLAGTDPKRHA
jgi:ribosomal protein S18 acetylase RimI-like enzyme